MQLGHVAALEASLHEGRTEPADHCVAEREGEAREGERGDQRFSIALERVCQYGSRKDRQGEQAIGFGARERGTRKRSHCDDVGSLIARGRYVVQWGGLEGDGGFTTRLRGRSWLTGSRFRS